MFKNAENDRRRQEKPSHCRTRAGMTAALELGRWVFLAPLGYINVPRAMGKSLMPDPERAPMVRRVFEAYATGRFTKQQVLGQARAWGLTNRRNRTLTSQAIGTLLRNRLYAGIVDVPEYGVRAKRGDFANRSRMSTVRSADWRRLGRSRTSDSTSFPAAMSARIARASSGNSMAT